MAKGGSKKSKQFTVELTGDKAFLAKLRRVLKEAPEIVASFLVQESEIIMTEAKKQTPVSTGALRSTGVVFPVKIQ